jgi:hypothetical protein
VWRDRRFIGDIRALTEPVTFDVEDIQGSTPF